MDSKKEAKDATKAAFLGCFQVNGGVVNYYLLSGGLGERHVAVFLNHIDGGELWYTVT